MTTLEGVNTILRGVGIDPVASIPTPGTGDIDTDRASVQFARSLTQIQRGEYQPEIRWATHSIVVSSYTGNPINGEIVKQTTSGATAILHYFTGGKAWLVVQTGTLAGTDNLTGETSAAVLTTGALTALPQMGVADWAVDDLPPAMAEYVAAHAATRYQQAWKRGRIDDQFLSRLEAEARQAFMFEDNLIGRWTQLYTTHQLNLRNAGIPGRWGSSDARLGVRGQSTTWED